MATEAKQRPSDVWKKTCTNRLENLGRTVKLAYCEIDRVFIYNNLPILERADSRARFEACDYITGGDKPDTPEGKALIDELGFRLGNPVLDAELQKMVGAALEMTSDKINPVIFNAMAIKEYLTPEERHMMSLGMNNLEAYLKQVQDIAVQEARLQSALKEADKMPEYVPAPKTLERPAFEMPPELHEAYVGLGVDPARTAECYLHRMEAQAAGRHVKAWWYFGAQVIDGGKPEPTA